MNTQCRLAVEQTYRQLRAAWNGTRIILRQVSPEANAIFDFIIALHRHCHGDWQNLAMTARIDLNELEGFLDYCAIFLSNIGNYFVRTLFSISAIVRLSNYA